MARHSRAVYRRRRLIVFGSTGLVASVLTALAVIGLAPLPSAAITPSISLDYTSEQAEIAVPPFGLTAVTADGFGLLTGAELNTPVPIASIAKVVTALVVLDERPIAEGSSGEAITFDSVDVQSFADSVANAESRAEVIEGMTLSQRDVIDVMLIKSANNFARTLVRWTFGSEEAYVEAANQWAVEHGLSETVIADSSGLSPATQSSLGNLLTLGELALANPVTATAVASVSTSIDPLGDVENSNKLLGVLGVNGIKTGTTDEAGACLLFSANLPIGETTVRIIGVTVGAPDHDSLNAALVVMLESLQAGFHVVTPVTSGSEVGVATTSWGTSTPLVAQETVSRLVWSDAPVTVTIPPTTTAVGNANGLASTVTVQFGDDVLSVDLLRTATMEDPGMSWRVAHIHELF